MKGIYFSFIRQSQDPCDVCGHTFKEVSVSMVMVFVLFWALGFRVGRGDIEQSLAFFFQVSIIKRKRIKRVESYGK